MAKSPKSKAEESVTIDLNKEQQEAILKKTGKAVTQLNISLADLLRKINTMSYD